MGKLFGGSAFGHKIYWTYHFFDKRIQQWCTLHKRIMSSGCQGSMSVTVAWLSREHEISASDWLRRQFLAVVLASQSELSTTWLSAQQEQSRNIGMSVDTAVVAIMYFNYFVMQCYYNSTVLVKSTTTFCTVPCFYFFFEVVNQFFKNTNKQFMQYIFSPDYVF